MLVEMALKKFSPVKVDFFSEHYQAGSCFSAESDYEVISDLLRQLFLFIQVDLDSYVKLLIVMLLVVR
jgi:hypothetical protein